ALFYFHLCLCTLWASMHASLLHSVSNATLIRIHRSQTSSSFWKIIHILPPIKYTIPIVQDIRTKIPNFFNSFGGIKRTFVSIQPQLYLLQMSFYVDTF